MEEDDPFGEIAQLAAVSSSQESSLRRCRFVRQVSPPSPIHKDENRRNPADIAYDIPGDSTPIILESPPESPPYDGSTHLEDHFHTPPEGSPSSNRGEDGRNLEVGRDGVGGDGTVDSSCKESLPAVDLGRDTDLGFSQEEVQLTQRIEIRVSKRGLSPAERSSSKRLKISGGSGAVNEISKKEFLDSSQKSKSRIASPCPREKDKPFPDAENLKLENQQNSRSRDEAPQEIHTRNATLVKSSNNLKGKSTLRIGSQNAEDEVRDSLEKLEPENQGNYPSRGQVSGGQCSKRSLICPTEAFDTEGRNAGIANGVASSGGKKDIEDIDRFRYTGTRPSDARSREREKEAMGKRVLPPTINSTMEAAMSPTKPTKRAEAPASSNAPRGTTTSATNATQGTVSNGLNKKKSKLKALGDVLKALSEYDKKGDDLSSLSLMEIARNRGFVVTPSWWPPEGSK